MSEEFLVSLDNADVVLSGKPVLCNIDWQIAAGQHWRVDGSNGAGKTTLLKTIAGLIWPVAKQPPSRHYQFGGRTTHLLAGVKKHIGFASYGMQDEYVRGMRNLSCYEVIASGFEQNIMVYDRLSDSQNDRVCELAEQLELRSQILQSAFLNASHGQKSVILFARALIHQPKLLILDEIFNGVDQRHFEIMIQVLHEFKLQGGLLVLSWHEHGIEPIEHLFTHRLQLKAGRIQSCSKLEIPAPRAGADYFGVKPTGKIHPADGKKLIELEHVNVFLSNKLILKDINWTIRSGERWLLAGENGAGKTSLLKILLAEIRPAIGSRIWRRGFGDRASVWQIRKLIGYVSPELQQSYYYNVSVMDAVASGFFASIGLYDELDQRQLTAVREQLQDLDLSAFADQGVHRISSGQMRRVMIARAMVHQPGIVIFDEIMANLDQNSRKIILQYITAMMQQGKTMIFVDHYNEEIFRLCNKIIELKQGRVIRLEDNHGHTNI